MIKMNDKIFTKDELRELERASNNLPENLNIYGNSRAEFGFNGVKMMLIPYTEENLTDLSKVLYSKMKKQKWGVIKESSFNIDFDLMASHTP